MGNTVIQTKNVSVSYGDTCVLHDVSLSFDKGCISALIGPSGCGKSTFLRCLNLMNREIEGCSIGGEIYISEQNCLDSHQNLYELRSQVGMVFQQPTPFNLSIRDNVLLAPRRHGRVRTRADEDALLEEVLHKAALWKEVRDRLSQSAKALSGGQQQRLCIARALAMRPEVILFDEPCSALDPISTLAVEETMYNLAAEGLCEVVVTHNLEQAGRIAHTMSFFYRGKVYESGATHDLFANPHTPELRDYLSGRFG